MIQDYLEAQNKIGKLYNSWLIEATNVVTALGEVENFVLNNFFQTSLRLENHPDFKFIEREEGNVKNISIDQIRQLQDFFSKTSAIADHRVGIIYQADLMNNKAANCCLKILEDTPLNSYIFLITSKASAILPTIRSRCAKISARQDINLNTEVYLKFVELVTQGRPADRLASLKELADKNRDLWRLFADSALHLMAKINKKAAGLEISLSENESRVMNRLNSSDPLYLNKKFEKIRNLVNNTINYDLDLRASFILLVAELSAAELNEGRAEVRY